MQKREMSFEDKVTSVFSCLKNNHPTISSPVISVTRNNGIIALLRVISTASLQNSEEVKHLAAWRKKNQIWFPSQFKVTLKGTKRWSKTALLEQKDRILFMILDLSGNYLGHVGLYRFDFMNKSCELDNVVRGANILPGVMFDASKALINWSKETLGLKDFTLKVFHDNQRALNLYHRLGFREILRIPLAKTVKNGVTSWEEITDKSVLKAERYFVEMKLIKNYEEL